MIAIAQDRSRTRLAHRRTPPFEELLPLIKEQARTAFRGSPPCQRDELIAEVVANCYVAYVRLIDRGLGDAIFATPLAQFAIRQVRVGRRVGSQFNVRDISSTHCQRSNGVRVGRLDHYVEEDGARQELVVEDRKATPADVACTRLDFAAWLCSLTDKQRWIAKTLATGETTAGVAKKFRVSAARVSQVRKELHRAWQDFQGELAVA